MMNLKSIFSIVILLAIPLTTYLVYQNTDSRQRASEEAHIYLVPDSPIALAGQTMTYTLAIDTNTTPVKSVQINLAYPTYKAEITEINTQPSTFDLPNEEIKGSGIIRLGREATTPQHGQQMIATIQLEAKKDIAAEEMTLAPGTHIITMENSTLSPTELVRTFPPDSSSKNKSFITTILDALRGILP